MRGDKELEKVHGVSINTLSPTGSLERIIGPGNLVAIHFLFLLLCPGEIINLAP
jgi:hypothetical protein